MSTKTFTIQTTDGPREVVQYATFTHYIQGQQFRFLVTRDMGDALRVTHRLSTKAVCIVTNTDMAACRFDYKDAGKLALDRLIKERGEARVRSVLAAAET
jgi:hypothetical protein